jgi:hypothetical protein
MDFTSDARETIEDLLTALPLPVREGVQQAAEARAESLATDAGAAKISTEIAVRAFIECTPADLRERLKHPLSYRGLDPDDFENAFNA